MSREAHVRFSEGLGVRLPRATRLIAVRMGFLSRDNVRRLLQKQVNLRVDMEAILVEMGALDQETLERERKAYQGFILDTMQKGDP